MDDQQIITLVGAIVGSGAVGTAITLLANRKKNTAEAIDIGSHAAAKIAEVATSMLVPLHSELKRLDEDHKRCEVRAKDLQNQVIHERQEVDRLKNRVTILEQNLKN